MIKVVRLPGGDYVATGVDAAWITDVCDVPTDRGGCRFPASQLERVREKLYDAGQELEVCGAAATAEKFADIPVRQCAMHFAGPIVKKAYGCRRAISEAKRAQEVAVPVASEYAEQGIPF